jgi:MoxR-like ATPase
MFMLKVGYPKPKEELAIAKMTGGDTLANVGKVLRGNEIQSLQKLIRQVPVSDHVALYCVKLGRATRPDDSLAPPFVKQYITWGIGSRAIQYLVLGAKARAALDGRPLADFDDLRAVAPTVLTHRLVINFAAEAAGRTAPDLVTELLATAPGD